MNRIALSLIVALVLASCRPDGRGTPSQPTGIQVCFSPGGGCTAAIVGALDAAREGWLQAQIG
jgi:hypothetical protein